MHPNNPIPSSSSAPRVTPTARQQSPLSDADKAEVDTIRRYITFGYGDRITTPYNFIYGPAPRTVPQDLAHLESLPSIASSVKWANTLKRLFRPEAKEVNLFDEIIGKLPGSSNDLTRRGLLRVCLANLDKEAPMHFSEVHGQYLAKEADVALCLQIGLYLECHNSNYAYLQTGYHKNNAYHLDFHLEYSANRKEPESDNDGQVPSRSDSKGRRKAPSTQGWTTIGSGSDDVGRDTGRNDGIYVLLNRGQEELDRNAQNIDKPGVWGAIRNDDKTVYDRVAFGAQEYKRSNVLKPSDWDITPRHSEANDHTRQMGTHKVQISRNCFNSPPAVKIIAQLQIYAVLHGITDFIVDDGAYPVWIHFPQESFRYRPHGPFNEMDAPSKVYITKLWEGDDTLRAALLAILLHKAFQLKILRTNLFSAGMPSNWKPKTLDYTHTQE